MYIEPTTPNTLFVVFAEPTPERDAEFQEWYDTVHGPDALDNGSFSAVHRFRAVGAGWRAAPYLALWEGRFHSEKEAWDYILPHSMALKEAGRVSDIASVRFAIMLFSAQSFAGLRIDPVAAITTVQNDWRYAESAASYDAWWSQNRLAARTIGTRWAATSDPAGRGAGYHLCVCAAEQSVEGAATGMSPLPPYKTIYGDTIGEAGPDDPPPAAVWAMNWEPITSLRA